MICYYDFEEEFSLPVGDMGAVKVEERWKKCDLSGTFSSGSPFMS